MLAEKFSITGKPKVTLLGIGMGSEDTLTVEGKRAVEQADLIVGARRMADAVKLPGQDVFMNTEARRSLIISGSIRSIPALS